MMMKDGKDKNKLEKKEEIVEDITKQEDGAKTLSSESSSNDDVDFEVPNSLNEELDELLDKDVKRFFGGCGG